MQLVEFITFFDLTKKINALISLAFPRFMHQSPYVLGDILGLSADAIKRLEETEIVYEPAALISVALARPSEPGILLGEPFGVPAQSRLEPVAL